MGFGAGDEPISMLFSALEVAGPEKHGNSPDQGDGKREAEIGMYPRLEGDSPSFSVYSKNQFSYSTTS
jgi:hypothetical protein